MQRAEASLPENVYLQQFDNPGLAGLYGQLRGQSEAYSKGMHKPGVRDVNRVVLANLMLDAVRSCAEGDYLEIGTYQGNFARMIWPRMVEGTRLYCFDTFEGFHSSDVSIEKQKTDVDVRVGHYADTTVEQVRRTICAGDDDDRLVVVRGRFPSSFKGCEHLRLRFVHLDADLYEPTAAGLKILWPRIVSGGVMIVHDYNALYPGVKKAVDEFFEQRSAMPVPYCDKSGSVVIFKSNVSTNE